MDLKKKKEADYFVVGLNCAIIRTKKNIMDYALQELIDDYDIYKKEIEEFKGYIDQDIIDRLLSELQGIILLKKFI